MGISYVDSQGQFWSINPPEGDALTLPDGTVAPALWHGSLVKPAYGRPADTSLVSADSWQGTKDQIEAGVADPSRRTSGRGELTVTPDKGSWLFAAILIGFYVATRKKGR